MEEHRVYKAAGVRAKVFGEDLRKCETAERAALRTDRLTDIDLSLHDKCVKTDLAPIAT